MQQQRKSHDGCPSARLSPKHMHARVTWHNPRLPLADYSQTATADELLIQPAINMTAITAPCSTLLTV